MGPDLTDRKAYVQTRHNKDEGELYGLFDES